MIKIDFNFVRNRDLKSIFILFEIVIKIDLILFEIVIEIDFIWFEIVIKIDFIWFEILIKIDFIWLVFRERDDRVRRVHDNDGSARVHRHRGRAAETAGRGGDQTGLQSIRHRRRRSN